MVTEECPEIKMPDSNMVRVHDLKVNRCGHAYEPFFFTSLQKAAGLLTVRRVTYGHHICSVIICL